MVKYLYKIFFIGTQEPLELHLSDEASNQNIFKKVDDKDDFAMLLDAITGKAINIQIRNINYYVEEGEV